MGLIKKYTKKVINIRTDNYQVISSADAKNLNPEIIEKREEFILIVYPDSRGEFDYFHNKHVLGILEKDSREKIGTILVANAQFMIKDKAITQILLQQALEYAKLKENTVVHTGIPQPLTLTNKGFKFSVRQWNYTNKTFVSESKDCCFTLA